MIPDRLMEEAEPFPEDWTPNMRANLVFLTRRGYVLLIHKKTGLGAGKINGPGGKLEPGETAIEAARREVREELLIEVGELEEMGELHLLLGNPFFTPSAPFPP